MRAATSDDAGPANAHARSIVHLEHVLGIAREGDLQRLIIHHHTLVTLANWVYIWGHWPLIAVSAAWLFRYRPDAYRLCERPSSPRARRHDDLLPTARCNHRR